MLSTNPSYPYKPNRQNPRYIIIRQQIPARHPAQKRVGHVIKNL